MKKHAKNTNYENYITFLTINSVLQVTHLHESRGAYHFSELAGPKGMAPIGVNGKVKAGQRSYSRDPRAEYTQELM